MSLAGAEARFDPVMLAIETIRKAGLSAAGFVSARPRTVGALMKDGHFEYGRTTNCRYSITARTMDGTGSGWAGWTGEDWTKADPDAMAARAIDLAQRSRNPVAVEPGRWTVVMTPEACAELVSRIGWIWSPMILGGAEADAGQTPFSKAGGGNKIGLQVLDERVTLSSDPMDPECGFVPFKYNLVIFQYLPVTWIDHGVLKALAYSTRAEAAPHGLEAVNNQGALRMAGGPTSIEEMIATTERGIYVTRFSNVDTIESTTLYMTGVTRDGTFLIENGKITKPVKNMRFEDSPMFFLNNLEAIGPSRRVAAGDPDFAYVMPPIKVRDFAFTSLTDSV
jgi:predicted Zn-dependent protease